MEIYLAIRVSNKTKYYIKVDGIKMLPENSKHVQSEMREPWLKLFFKYA
jgi:hypothetical protein